MIMITQKLKTCSICEKPSVLWKSSPPMCKNCAMRAKNSLVQTENGLEAKAFKVQYNACKVRKGKSLTAEKIADKKALNEFFALQAEQVPERCWNCGGLLNAFADWQKRFVTAHILPKNDKAFPSVAAHPLNRMFLGHGLFSNCNCHNLWDDRDAAARKTMPVYEKAIELVEQFYPELTNHEQVKACDYLGINISINI